jgi:hypothetical protein
MTSLGGSGRRCHRARVAVTLASSPDSLQGTFEKIHLRGLLGEQLFELLVLSPIEGRMGAWSGRLFSGLNHFELPASLVQAPPCHS